MCFGGRVRCNFPVFLENDTFIYRKNLVKFCLKKREVTTALC